MDIAIVLIAIVLIVLGVSQGVGVLCGVLERKQQEAVSNAINGNEKARMGYGLLKPEMEAILRQLDMKKVSLVFTV